MCSQIRRQGILVFLAFTLVSAADAQQDAASCGIADSVPEQVDQADAVLLGSVVRVRRSLSDQLAIDVAVEQAWKGVSGTTVGILAGGGIGGVDLEVGDRRVFYPFERDGLLMLNICRVFELPPRDYGTPINDPDEFLRLGIEPVELTVGDDPVYPPIDDPMFAPVDFVCPFATVALEPIPKPDTWCFHILQHAQAHE